MTRWLFAWLLALPLAVADDTPRDERGWVQGTPAAGTGALLTPRDPIPVLLPDWATAKVTGPTLLFYFSPGCPHCQTTIGEVVEWSQQDPTLQFIGVATSRTTQDELDAFAADYSVPFELVIDTPQGLAFSIGARSTPTVILVQPDGSGGVLAVDHYAPWFEGASLVARLRRDPSRMGHFEPGRYWGDYACSTCHGDESESMGLTHHAASYRTIYLGERADDKDCVRCHVTGLDQGGFELGDHGSVLAKVGCEACHGPGGPHDGARQDARGVCVTCHDAEHSIAFSVEKGLPHIDHYFATRLSEADQEALWMKLAQGQAPRPLLAFPEGPNVGPEVCAECHAAEVQAWSASGHAGAMAHLDRKQSNKTECVSCHATPAVTGPPPASADGYLSKTGVSCESCHGSAAEHVAAPSAGNIQGLGESCPECVLEAICTTCHTDEWDKDWDLSTHMERIQGHR